MPAPGGLTGALINTGELFQDVLANIEQLIKEHLDYLKCKGVALDEKNIVKYDEIKPVATPWISIVFESAKIMDIRLNNCGTFSVNVNLFYYFESLSFGNDTFDFLSPLYRLAEMFLIHSTIYGLTNGTNYGTQINNASLVGRMLEADTYITGQLDLTINVKVCPNDHS